MKNESSRNTSTTDSPKTPGGISRSLLTPCRRLGLSRKFRNSGALPFQSPLSSNSDDKQEKVETRKRKESLEETPETSNNVGNSGTLSEVVQTPTRNVELPPRKKSKTLIASIQKSTEEVELLQQKNSAPVVNKTIINASSNKTLDSEHTQNKTESVPSPLRLKSKSRSRKKISPSNSISIETPTDSLEKENLNNHNLVKINKTDKIDNTSSLQKEVKAKSPNNLTKECIVVIQKKIFKKELKDNKRQPNDVPEPKDTKSQGVFDSDSDDVPLVCLNKEITDKPASKSIDDNDDFNISKPQINKPSSTKLRVPKTETISPTSSKNKTPSRTNVEIHTTPISQTSADDDDFFEKKKTILIKKSYNKVAKLQKAKSTGSITQKDIDDLRSRIEMKKKLLLARGMKEDTKELRDSIKKWQKGCQDAILELMDLMKVKLPDKKNMDYSEMLKILKIPASLVCYDSDDDCFLTPDDQSIILANVKD